MSAGEAREKLPLHPHRISGPENPRRVSIASRKVSVWYDDEGDMLEVLWAFSWTLRNSSGVSKGIDKSVVQSGWDFPYIRVGGGQ